MCCIATPTGFKLLKGCSISAMNYVQLAIPYFILAIILESIYGYLRKNQTYRLNDTVNSLQMGMLSRLVGVLYSNGQRIRGYIGCWRLSPTIAATTGSTGLVISGALCGPLIQPITKVKNTISAQRCAKRVPTTLALSFIFQCT